MEIVQSLVQIFQIMKILTENRTENNSDDAHEIIENSNQNSSEDLIESSSDETKIQKTAKSQIDIN